MQEWRQMKEIANVGALRGRRVEKGGGSERVFSGAFMSISGEGKDARARCRSQSGSQDPQVTTVYIQDK